MSDSPLDVCHLSVASTNMSAANEFEYIRTNMLTEYESDNCCTIEHKFFEK